MQFFTDIEGDLYPISAIRRIGKAREVTFTPSNRKGDVHTVALKGDETTEITAAELAQIREAPLHMIPALPETKIVRWNKEDATIDYTTVVAWAYTAEGLMYPVTLDGINDGSMHASLDVLMHDGSVVRAADRNWENLGLWRAFVSGESSAS